MVKNKLMSCLVFFCYEIESVEGDQSTNTEETFAETVKRLECQQHKDTLDGIQLVTGHRSSVTL